MFLLSFGFGLNWPFARLRILIPPHWLISSRVKIRPVALVPRTRSRAATPFLRLDHVECGSRAWSYRTIWQPVDSA
jgi:hypothetical protein